jgi:hypothetical protein
MLAIIQAVAEIPDFPALQATPSPLHRIVNFALLADCR